LNLKFVVTWWEYLIKNYILITSITFTHHLMSIRFIPWYFFHRYLYISSFSCRPLIILHNFQYQASFSLALLLFHIRYPTTMNNMKDLLNHVRNLLIILQHSYYLHYLISKNYHLLYHFPIIAYDHLLFSNRFPPIFDKHRYQNHLF